MKILLLDNYDSFTYNVVHLILANKGVQVEVFRNDAIAMEAVKQYDKIILSPGPGIPAEAGMMMEMIIEYAASKPILGICLGHQAIGEVFGATLVNLQEVYHGVATNCTILEPNATLFRGMNQTLQIGRYHSWIVSKEGFPPELDITAMDDLGYIMALQHKTLPISGVQFHPESILTPLGDQIMKNFIQA